MAQSRWVAGELMAKHDSLEVELVIVRTTGDRVQDVALHEVGGKGLFTKEVEEALLGRDADLAVHSLKDLPWEIPQGLTIAAYTVSEDPRDALVSRSGSGLDDLPAGARVGTSSLRRVAQLRAYRPDLRFEPMRGNIDTRLRKLQTEGWDAIVLAGAGLSRLGLADRITEWLPTSVCLPAAGQGIVAVQVREDDAETGGIVGALDCRESRIRAEAERSAMAQLGGGCRTPMGFLATVDGNTCRLEGFVASPDGEVIVRTAVEGSAGAPAALGAQLAEALLATGA